MLVICDVNEYRRMVKSFKVIRSSHVLTFFFCFSEGEGRRQFLHFFRGGGGKRVVAGIDFFFLVICII